MVDIPKEFFFPFFSLNNIFPMIWETHRTGSVLNSSNEKKIGTEGVKERHYFSSLELQNGPLCREGFDSNLDFGYKNISFLRTLSFMNISLSNL